MAEGSIENVMSLVGVGFTPAGAPVKGAATTLFHFSIFTFQFLMQAQPAGLKFNKEMIPQFLYLKFNNPW